MPCKKREDRNFVIIVSAPSGSGKTTLVSLLMEKVGNITRSVSYTTREPRKGEVEGEDYFFVTKDEFREKVRKNDFLEWEENFGHFYGTSRTRVEEALKSGKDIILNIDVKGAKSVKEKYPESISIFVMPPSREELEERLRNRNTDNEKEVSIRLERAEMEIKASDEYDFLIVNDSIEDAVDELKTIIEEERKSRT